MPESIDRRKSAAGPDGWMAWIESRDDIATLCAARGGELLLERSLARTDTLDFGYEGCAARHLSWCGNRIVAVTSERLYSFLCSIDPETGSDEVLHLGHSWAIDGDLLLYAGDDPGLVLTAALPSLDARPPLPYRGAPAARDVRLLCEEGRLEVRAGRREVDRLTLPDEGQRMSFEAEPDLFDAIEHLLFHGAQPRPGARFVIEAAAYPFVRPTRERNAWRGSTPSPVWMPVYWHRHLLTSGAAREAHEFFDVLEELARRLPESERERGWNPSWSSRDAQIQLASRYVCRQSRTLAAVCRSGALPPGWYCFLFDPAPQSDAHGSRVDPTRYPPVLRDHFARLAQSAPPRLKESR